MFAQLEEVEPPVDGIEARRAVAARVGRLRLRRRMRMAGAGSIVTLVASVGALALLDTDDTSNVTTVSPPDAETTTSTAPATTTVPAASVPAPTPTTRVVATTSTVVLRVEPVAARSGAPAVPLRPGVKLSLRLQRQTVAPGDAILGLLTIENGSTADVAYRTLCLQDGYEHGLYRLGRWVGGTGNVVCPAVVTPLIVVPPGSRREVTMVFDALTVNDRGEHGLLPSGTYQASAAIPNPDGAGFWFAPAVDVTIPSGTAAPALAGNAPVFKPPAGVRMALELPRKVLAVGEKLPGTLTIDNGSSKDFTVAAFCGQPSAAWGLYREGFQLGGRATSDSTECEQTEAITVPPGGTLRIGVEFDTTGRSSYESGTKKYDRLAPGRYQAGAGVYHAEAHRAWFAPPVDIEVR